MSRSCSIKAGLSVRDMDNAFVISKRHRSIEIMMMQEASQLILLTAYNSASIKIQTL